ncbi:hypothetical protein [Agrococcus sp. TF02-05]|uniref:hypothetical protein n=1 Tax=Agrococcus sp. TF02-05 TaxID=2815211 RepID=UPI001AA0E54E|nr:hypothetical protein [Agrococcus sp. TF02-05]MBO1770272.1 hypothetical protein [Agrococcus sp. TF02-05]
MSAASLREELTRESPRGFRIAFPPGWRHYPVDDRGRAALLRDIAERAKLVGRPDVDAALRRKAREQFDGLRQSRGVAMYVPGAEATAASGMPMSVVASRWLAPAGTPLEADVRARAGAEVVRIDMPHGTVLRWVVDRDGASTREGVLTRTVSYVHPEPGDDARRGILLTAGILHLGTDETDRMADALVELADAIVETFRWS